MMTDEEAQVQATACARQGRLVEAGWVMALLKGTPDDLPLSELLVLRGAFFAGAKHMLALMVGAQRRDDLDMQQVVNDLRGELDRFREELGLKN
jgi:hypothetical protein